MSVVQCEILDDGRSVNCSGLIYVEEEKPLTYEDAWFWGYLGIYAALVLMAGKKSYPPPEYLLVIFEIPL